MNEEVKFLILKLDKKLNLSFKLSENFTLREMLFGTNDRLLKSLSLNDQITFIDTIMESFNDTILNNLKRVCVVLEIIRAYLEEPIIITCGYRSLGWELYKGRSGKSKHATGEAADMTFTKASLQYVYDWLNVNIKIGGRGVNHKQDFIHYDIRNNFAEWNY
jgi:uncharacterized protein YcbK (DUF882 family)